MFLRDKSFAVFFLAVTFLLMTLNHQFTQGIYRPVNEEYTDLLELLFVYVINSSKLELDRLSFFVISEEAIAILRLCEKGLKVC